MSQFFIISPVFIRIELVLIIIIIIFCRLFMTRVHNVNLFSSKILGSIQIIFSHFSCVQHAIYEIPPMSTVFFFHQSYHKYALIQYKQPVLLVAINSKHI